MNNNTSIKHQRVNKAYNIKQNINSKNKHKHKHKSKFVARRGVSLKTGYRCAAVGRGLEKNLGLRESFKVFKVFKGFILAFGIQ